MRPAPDRSDRDRKYSRRQFMVYAAVLDDEGTGVLTAIEAVSSWALDNPEVNMDEEMTWAEWHAQGGAA